MEPRNRPGLKCLAPGSGRSRAVLPRRPRPAAPVHGDLYFNAEWHRLAGECHLALGESDAAEAALQQAIETARRQGAKTFELRAASSLGRVWEARGQRDRASTLLKTICDALGDAEETIDVPRARASLAEWS